MAINYANIRAISIANFRDGDLINCQLNLSPVQCHVGLHNFRLPRVTQRMFACDFEVCLHISRQQIDNGLLVCLQITCTMVALWHHLRRGRGSEFRRYGLLNNHIIPDATLCYHINCLLPVEDEQGLRTHNVYVIFCIRCYFADVRIRVVQVSTLKRLSKTKTQIHQRKSTNSTQVDIRTAARQQDIQDGRRNASFVSRKIPPSLNFQSLNTNSK